MKKALSILVLSSLMLSGCFGSEEETDEQPQAKEVRVIEVGEFEANGSVEAVGVVKPATQVDIVSITGGTVEKVHFEEGDSVKKGQLLVNLYKSDTITNLNNAQISYNNAKSSFYSTERLADEAINQAEIGLKNAEVSVHSAKIGITDAEIGVSNAQLAVSSAEIDLKTAQDNLANSSNLISKGNEDTISTAIISYSDYKNTVFNALDQVDYLIGEDDEQMTGVGSVLGAKSQQSLINTRRAYRLTRNLYEDIEDLSPTTENIEQLMNSMVELLDSAADMLEKTVVLLNNTISSSSFSETSLNTQKTAFSTLKTTVVTANNAAESTLNSLENIPISSKSDLDQLENAVSSAESRLKSSKNSLASAQNALEAAKNSYEATLVAKENSESSLENAKESKKQQIISAQTALDSAKGQLDLAKAQAAYLSIESPINGKITAKSVEVGTEVQPGQKLGEVSQTEMLKIELDLPAEEIFKIEEGQEVKIDESRTGKVSKIFPAADPVTRKVRVEIEYNNEKKDLIPNTYVDVLMEIDISKLDLQDGAFLVPLSAVSIAQTETYAFVYENGLAKKVQLVIGDVKGKNVEVLEGLKKGDLLIVEQNKRLSDGEEVTLLGDKNNQADPPEKEVDQKEMILIFGTDENGETTDSLEDVKEDENDSEENSASDLDVDSGAEVEIEPETETDFTEEKASKSSNWDWLLNIADEANK